VRYSSWGCEGSLNPYDSEIPSSTRCTTTCPAWRGLGDEPLVLESTCVEGNEWTTTRPSQSPGFRALPYATTIYNTPDMDDMVCGCQDVGPFDYNPNNEDLAELVCRGRRQKDFDIPGGWNFTTTDRCDLFCNQEPAVSVYCDGISWVGEPEKGIWCYTRPENPGPIEAQEDTGEWQLVAILKGSSAPPTAAIGDLANCLDNNCKLSDTDINALKFSIIKFEPAQPSDSTPVTYFDFRGRKFNSSQRVPACATPWTLDEAKALSGNFDGSETCCAYDVCNFGRGHCSSTVKSSYGYKSYGGCGSSGPIIGTTGVRSGTSVRISVA